MEFPDVTLPITAAQAGTVLLVAFLASIFTELIKPLIKHKVTDAEDADLWILGIVWAASEIGMEAAALIQAGAQITAKEIGVAFLVGMVGAAIAIGGWNLIVSIIDKIKPKKPTT